jgi:hypothetical protein
MLFLGSSTDGTVPYAEMNGQKLIAQDATQKNKKSEGSNAIIQQVAEYFKLSWPKGEISKNGNTEEKKLRRQIDYDLFKSVYKRQNKFPIILAFYNSSNKMEFDSWSFNYR